MSPPRNADLLAYQLHVALLDVEPEVWRRLLVPADTPLRRLHRILQLGMGWGGDEAWAFEAGDLRYGEPDPEMPGDLLDARGVRLRQLLPDVGSEILYEYDFGDAWLHRVRLERIAPADPALTLPLCVGGARACPPVGCGGAYGYEELVTSGTLEAERFDVRIVNGRLEKV